MARVQWLTAWGACPTCRQLDGLEFDAEDPALAPPVHERCRCLLLPPEEAEAERRRRIVGRTLSLMARRSDG